MVGHAVSVLQIRAVGQLDPNGNIRLAIYRNGPISFDFHARVFGT
jgi:hypothetical protein